MIRALLVDDEPRSSVNLNSIINNLDSTIEIVGSATNITSAEEIIRAEQPNVLFLDVEMPGGSGFDLLAKIADIEIYVIFVSAYDEYALDAFKAHAIHYLLKPIDIDDLADAIKLLKKRLPLSESNGNVLSIIDKVGNELADIIKVPTIAGFELISRKSVVYIKSVGSYSEIVLLDSKKFTVSKNIKQLEVLFSETVFFRVHKSYLVNLKYVLKYHRGRGGYLELDDLVTIPVAVRRKKELLALLNK